MRIAIVFSALAFAVPAAAGPPFLTDDPVPTDTGHWEIYGPFADIEGRGGDYAGSTGAEINYGAAAGVQITVGLPIAYAHDASGGKAAGGDFELSVKYRVFEDAGTGLSVAIFPGLTVPTAGKALGAGRVTALLPVWAQKDFGPWSLFGGGGYAINPGPGNRDYWTGGLALSRQFGQRVLVGIEADRQGPDAIGAGGKTSLGIGTIISLGKPFRLLASGGPTFEDGAGRAGYHGYIALGLDL
ncbi:MAG: hypothetical protein JSR96_03210 [Proteobacteria bacterium]|nr:hypothetical protein [Pseudomonadota bacterium]